MNLNLICGKDELRPVMTYVFVTKENCVATDAHALGVVPTEEMFSSDFIERIPEDGVLIHSTDWAKFKGSNNVVWHGDGVGVAKIYYPKKKAALIEVESPEKVGKYPNWKAIVPKFSAIEKENLSDIGLNPALLANLYKALGFEKGVKLTFYGSNKAIMVHKSAMTESRIYGLIMPVMLND